MPAASCSTIWPTAGRTVPRNLDGVLWPQKKVAYARAPVIEQFKKLADTHKFRGYDGAGDGVWTTRRGNQLIMLNTTANAVVVAPGDLKIPAHEIATTETLP